MHPLLVRDLHLASNDLRVAEPVCIVPTNARPWQPHHGVMHSPVANLEVAVPTIGVGSNSGIPRPHRCAMVQIVGNPAHATSRVVDPTSAGDVARPYAPNVHEDDAKDLW